MHQLVSYGTLHTLNNGFEPLDECLSQHESTPCCIKTHLNVP